MKTEDLLTLIEIAEKKRLSFVKVGDIEFSFSSTWKPPDEASSSEVETSPKPHVKRGADGLTAEEQEELYGSVFDAKE